MLYMDKIRQRLSDLGYAIYDAPAPVGSYVQCVRTGNLLHLSGGISVNGDDKYFGKVGKELTGEEGQAAARRYFESSGRYCAGGGVSGKSIPNRGRERICECRPGFL